MRYLPHTDQEIDEMLEATGHASLNDLFSSVPPECRYEGEIPITTRMTEWQLKEHFANLANDVHTD